MCDRKNERMLEVHFERDDIWKTVDDCAADAQWRSGSPWPEGKRRGDFSDLIQHRRHLCDELIAQPGASLVIPDGRRANSARASGCSSTRTTVLELLQNLRPRGAPVDRLDLTLRDLARSALQLTRPRRRDLLNVGLLQAGEHFFR